MADIFISYAKPDVARAQQLADALSEKFPWTIWWDRKIAPGKNFDVEIAAQLELAQCAIVLWSRHAKTSEWVGNEAAAAAERKILIPVLYDGELPPLAFRRLQGCNLNDWDGDADNEQFRDLVKAISDLISTANVSQMADQPQAIFDAPNPTKQRTGKGKTATDRGVLKNLEYVAITIAIAGMCSWGIWEFRDDIESILKEQGMIEEIATIRGNTRGVEVEDIYPEVIKKFTSQGIAIYVVSDLIKGKLENTKVEYSTVNARSFYGYFTPIEGKEINELIVKQLPKLMDDDDYKDFLADQKIVIEKYQNGEISSASVPIKFSDKHPVDSYKGKLYYPIIAHRYRTSPIGGMPAKDHLSVIYVDIANILDKSKCYINWLPDRSKCVPDTQQ